MTTITYHFKEKKDKVVMYSDFLSIAEIRKYALGVIPMNPRIETATKGEDLFVAVYQTAG